MNKIKEWYDVDRSIFETEIATSYKPAIMRGFVNEWPAVQETVRSNDAICDYLKRGYEGGLVDTILGPPSSKGRIFYENSLREFNFCRKKEPFETFLQRLLDHVSDPEPPAIALQSAPVRTHFPKFSDTNSMALFDSEATPRIWIGNAVTVAAHFDDADNIACTVAGRRRFTLFPPEQISNLYVGPLNYTPGGAPVSLVDLESPDLERYPKFKDALAAALVGELRPGDAIFIPKLWWHHVESLDAINVLVNFWSGGSIGVPNPGRCNSAFDSMLHSLLTIRDLPQAHREAWRAFFDYYVFRMGEDPAAHLPPGSRHVLGEITPSIKKQLTAWLIHKLKD